MALKHKITGQYLRIGKEDMLSQIVLQIFENSDHREEGDNAFKKHQRQIVHMPKLIEKLGNETVDKIVRAAYELLKEQQTNIPGVGLESKYNDWEDC